MSLEPGQILDGKYRIVRLLGSGGMGSVYEGENARIHRKVAIKVLHAGVAAKQDVVQRFEREAQAAGRIGSEHIVEVLDLGSLPGGERYMVMEFLDGVSLGDRIKGRKRLEPREVAPIVHQMLEGLAAAHEAGIIHRDLKPDNVYLLSSKGGQKDFVKVLDFGVSKFSALEQDSMSMTRTGAVMGTPYYMSPEQARGAKIDPRSDLYSVGVVLYQAVTGRVPFNAETFNELVFKIALESPHPAELVTPGLDPSFATIIAKSMMRDPVGRFQSAREFQAALATWIQSGQGVSANGGAAFNPSPAQYGQPVGGGTQALPIMHAAGFAPNASAPNFQAPMMGNNPQLGASQPPQYMPQQGQGPMHQSSPQLGMSQAGLAMTAPQPRGNGAMIAIGLVGTLVLAGGGFGVYKFMGARAAAAAAAASVTATAPPAPPPEPTPAPPETATPVATAEPSVADTAAPSTNPASAAAPPTPPTPGRLPGAVAQPARTPPPPAGAGKKPPPTPSATPAAKTGGGRSVSGEL